MSFDQDNKDKPLSEGEDIQWTKEDAAAKDGRFDFDAFLNSDSLEAQVSRAMDKKEPPRPASTARTAPNAAPKPAGERGRHEAPGPAPEEDQSAGDEGDDLTADLPTRQGQGGKEPVFRTVYDREREEPKPQRQAVPDAPPRPKVVVADPTPPPRVYVQPPRQYDEPAPSRGNGGGGGGSNTGLKWLIALLLAAAVLLGGYVFARQFLLTAPSATPSPAPTGDYLGATMPPRPTDAPVPTEPPKVYHTITVTAGSGGSVSPSGSRDVEEGTSINFIITPELGFEISQILVDGAPVSIQNAYIFENVRQDHTLYVVFQPLAAAPATDVPVTEPPAPTEAPVTPEPVTPEPVTPEPATPEPAPPVEDMVEDMGPAA